MAEQAPSLTPCDQRYLATKCRQEIKRIGDCIQDLPAFGMHSGEGRYLMDERVKLLELAEKLEVNANG